MLSAGAYADEELKALLADRLSCRVERGDARFGLKAAEKAVLAQYGEDAYASLPRNNPAAALALGGLLSYLHETQKSDLSYISDLEYYEQGRFMELDLSARRNLELTETIRGKEKRGSLLWVLDKTKTAMGARCLRSWLERPLREVAAITRRSNAVGALVNDTMAREELVLALSGISDMERLIGRIVYGTAGGRDLVSLRNSIEQLAAVAASSSRTSPRAGSASFRRSLTARGHRCAHRRDHRGRAAVLRARGRLHPQGLQRRGRPACTHILSCGQGAARLHWKRRNWRPRCM